MKKKTHDEFLIDVENLFEEEYKVLSEYKNNKTSIRIEHSCGYSYEATPNYFLRKERPCPVCSKSSNKLNTEILYYRIKNLTNNEYELVSEYNGRKKPCTIKHLTCNKDYTYNTLDNFLGTQNRKGRRCPYCEGRVYTLTEDYIGTIIKEKYNDNYILNNIHENNIELVHRKCNENFIVDRYNFIHSNRNDICPICYGYNSQRDIDAFKKQFNMRYPDSNIKILSDFIGKSHDKIKVIHLECNNTYEITPTNLLSGKRCPFCNKSKTFSYEEKEILEYIKTFYKGTIIENDRSILNGKELDIFLPDENLAIEFNGLFWHGEKHIEKSYHLDKTLKCNEKGIRLIHIFEDEWLNKKEIVKSKISNILKNNYNKEKIYARKCYIKEISNKDKKDFLERNHIQGSDQSSIKLGLFYKNILVSVMTFCKPRVSLGQKNNKYDYELSRFANNIEYRVIGSFGKLFSYFKNNYEWDNIITYADLRWSAMENNIYEKNNFNIKHISKPNYWYFNSKTLNRVHRYTFKKQNLKKLFPLSYDINKTEYEIMLENNYDRIYDCGNIVFEYKK